MAWGGKMAGAYIRKPKGSRTRTDREPGNRALFESNRKIILATETICAICGKPVDKSLKYPDPMSPAVDHIIPVSKNGDPSSLDNLQLTHRVCNGMKGDRLPTTPHRTVDENRKLPLTENWAAF